MKFENPIMNISMFEVENVVTTSGGETPVEKTAAADAAAAYLEGKAGVTVTF